MILYIYNHKERKENSFLGQPKPIFSGCVISYCADGSAKIHGNIEPWYKKKTDLGKLMFMTEAARS